MTRQEAIEALNNSKIVTHEYFADDEFIKKIDEEFYEDEKGYHLLINEFWSYRKSKGFDEGWRIKE